MSSWGPNVVQFEIQSKVIYITYSEARAFVTDVIVYEGNGRMKYYKTELDFIAYMVNRYRMLSNINVTIKILTTMKHIIQEHIKNRG